MYVMQSGARHEFMISFSQRTKEKGWKRQESVCVCVCEEIVVLENFLVDDHFGVAV